MKALNPLHLAVGGCGLTILGSCLPWVSVSILDQTQTTNGLDGDGGITITLAVIALVLAFLKVPGKEKVFAIIGAILTGLAAVIGLYDMSKIRDSVQGLFAGLGGDAFKVSVGVGLYLVIAGGAIGAVGFVMKMASSRASAPPPLPPAP